MDDLRSAARRRPSLHQPLILGDLFTLETSAAATAASAHFVSMASGPRLCSLGEGDGSLLMVTSCATRWVSALR